MTAVFLIPFASATSGKVFTVQTKAFYVDGKEEGRYTVYYSNGNVRYTGEYLHGRQTGEWRFYNEDGTLSHTQSY